MQFKVKIALQELNRRYDAMLAYLQTCKAMDIENSPNYVLFHKTVAVIAHDRILTDMVEPTGRTGEREYQRQLARLKIRAFFSARNPYK